MQWPWKRPLWKIVQVLRDNPNLMQEMVPCPV